MSDHPSAALPLPVAWAAMLDAIDARLRESAALADARAADFGTASDEPMAVVRRVEWAELAAVTAALQERSARTAGLAGEFDAALSADEAFLRPHVTAAESCRARLAAWAARAIG